MKRTLLFALCCITAVSCADDPLWPADGLVASDAALGRTIERDASAAMQTDSLVYHLTADSDRHFSVDVPFGYRNDTGKGISIPNCQGVLMIGLEKRTDEGWDRFFEPITPLCLSAPIRIRAGAVVAETARIAASLPGFNSAPEFASSDLDGEYRLVWHGLIHGSDPSPESAVGAVHSNPFLLVAPE